MLRLIDAEGTEIVFSGDDPKRVAELSIAIDEETMLTCKVGPSEARALRGELDVYLDSVDCEALLADKGGDT